MINNPRFPHNVKIVRMVDSDVYNPFEPSDGQELVVYQGKCRNYKNNNTKEKDGVYISDFVLSIPFTLIDIKAGDTVLLEDRVRVIKGIVVDNYLGNIGLNVYYNKINN
jgi:hypothetical protein